MSVLTQVTRRLSFAIYKRIMPGLTPEFGEEDLEREGFFSQHGQDKWLVERFFPGRTDGVFVDIGANDGVTLSNTLHLERLGWTGLAVEPIPSVYERLQQNRRCATVHGCVARGPGRRIFREISGGSQMLSGLLDQYDPRHLERIQREVALDGGTWRDIEVEAFGFHDLMDRHGIRRIDYLSLDVEGGEYQILKSIDFQRTPVAVLSVENNYQDVRIPLLLRRKGFRWDSMVGDEFYSARA